MSETRYSRQTILDGFGAASQEKLSKAKVLVVGAGGLGVPVLTYLNAMGVGEIGIVDNDVVSITNLHRQVLYNEFDVGKPKLEMAYEKLKAQNSNTKITLYKAFLDITNALEIIRQYDCIVDATDNFPTRYLINDACVILEKPFVYGALHAFEGQVSVFNHKGGATYRCLFPNMPKANEVPNCNENGVLGIVPGIIGNFQALEVVKILTGIGEPLSGKLLIYDGLSQAMQIIKFSPVADNLKIDALQSNYDFSCEVDVFSIEADELKEISEKSKIELIDVRTPEEFEEVHLKEAKNIPLSELEKRTDEINFTTPVYVICQSGIRSNKAITILTEIFPKQRFINVDGGMNAIVV